MHPRLTCLSLISAIAVVALPVTTPARALAHAAESKIVSSEGIASDSDRLFQQGIEEFRQGAFESALKTYQQVLILRSNLNDRAGMAETLDNIGEVYISLSEYGKALENLEQALTIRGELYDQAGVSETLNNLGFVYRQIGDYPKALELHQQALEISRSITDRAIEGESLHNMASVYAATGEYDRALEFYQQALAIRQEVGDKRDRGRTLNNIGAVYYNLGNYARSLEFYQQALTLRQDIGDRAGVARILSNIGLLYRQLGETENALGYYQQALPLLREMGDRASLGNTLNGMGVLYENVGDYEQALAYYQQALEIAREIDDKAGLGKTLDNIGGIYYSIGEYPKALEYYQQASLVREAIADKAGVGNSLVNLGGLYYNLGQYPEALELLEQALVIRREVGDKAEESRTLDAIAIVYEKLGQSAQALANYQEALDIARAIQDKSAEGNALEHLGSTYANLGENYQGLEFLQQALEVLQKIGDKAGQSRTLNSIAAVYYRLKDYSKTLDYLQQSLTLLQEVGDRSGEAITLGNIGRLLEQQNQLGLAIVFYKKAVNLNESLRQSLKVLSMEQQESFTETVAEVYRRLADLLLKQNRAIEAQQVLDLLKIQELDEYLRNVRGNEKTASGVELLPAEQEISDKYAAIQSQAIALAQKLRELQQIPATERSPEQQEQMSQIERLLQEIQQKFNQFIRSPEVRAIAAVLNRTTGGQNLNLTELDRLQTALKQLQQKSVVLYPLVLDDRLELILVTPDAPPLHRTVPVTREELNRAIAQFRQELTAPTKRTNISGSQEAGRQLYNWLIQPLENELDRIDAKMIIYAPDGPLRYIPLSALYDGEQWLVERYIINNITAASLTDFNTQRSPQLRVLAGAFTEGTYNIEVGTRAFAFDGLPFAGKEVENLADIIPSTTKLLDEAFTRSATVPHLNDYNIVHLATHAAFVSGQPEDSFILLGDGDRITLRDIDTWSLPNVELVVLSACQTALGGQLGNGREILGFGYQMQQAGAKAAIASLWSVDDGGTQALMDAFYESLQTGTNKAEALRNAQLSAIASQYQHPYYWAPFILIGNGW